jgi:hypothetical protein
LFARLFALGLFLAPVSLFGNISVPCSILQFKNIAERIGRNPEVPNGNARVSQKLNGAVHPLLGQSNSIFLETLPRIKSRGGLSQVVRSLAQRRAGTLINYHERFQAKIDPNSKEIAILLDGVSVFYNNALGFEKTVQRYGRTFEDTADIIKNIGVDVGWKGMDFKLEFPDEKARTEHRKHHAEFGIRSDKEYEQLASEYLRTPMPNAIVMVGPRKDHTGLRYSILNPQFGEILVMGTGREGGNPILISFYTVSPTTEMISLMNTDRKFSNRLDR